MRPFGRSEPMSTNAAVQLYTASMKWLSLTLGILFVLLSWLLLQIAKGYTFTYGGYEEWNEEFLNKYNACCLWTDLKSVAPFALVGLACLLFSVWLFARERSKRSSNSEKR